jgi:hypothetical protein
MSAGERRVLLKAVEELETRFLEEEEMLLSEEGAGVSYNLLNENEGHTVGRENEAGDILEFGGFKV